MRDRIGVRARVRAPASSANLGPGFDSFGLALGWYDMVGAEVCARGLRVEVTGHGAATIPRDESHLVVTAMRATFTALEVTQPGLELHCRNVIPHGRGLGSSAAAIVSGVLLAEQLAGRELGEARRLDLAAAQEGHPDNVAACLLGGFTIAWTEGPRSRALRLDVDSRVSAKVFVPGTPLSTRTARGLLPDDVPHRAASANAARSGLLAAAMTLRPEVLLAATADRLHQDYRRPAMPDTLALVDALREAGVAAVVSGAGPTVLALVTPDQPVDLDAWTRPGWQSHALDIDGQGALTDAGGPSSH